MKAKLPHLSLVCLATVVAHPAFGQVGAERNAGWDREVRAEAGSSSALRQGFPPRTAAGPAPGPGDQLIGRALAAINSHASVTAAIRQRAEVSGHRLVGKGRYLQLGRGPEMRVRLELKIQVGDQVSSFLRLTDERYLWTDRQEGDQRRVERVDLGRLRDASSEIEPGSAVLTELPPTGGLPDLLAALATCFQFAEPKAGRLGNLPTYNLWGQWRPSELADLVPDIAVPEGLRWPAGMDRVPAHIPHEVLLVLGRDDLFPHVFEYRRGRTGQGRGAPEGPWPMLRMELFEVRINVEIDRRQFVYRSGDVEHADNTKRYLERLRGRQR